MGYTPRLKAEDFGILSAPLNEAEKDFVVQEMWAHLSKQQFKINLSDFDDYSEVFPIIYGYLYGFSDGYLQQFEACDWLEFRGLVGELGKKLIERQVQVQGEQLIEVIDFDSDFDEEGESFLNALNLGGVDGVNAAINKRKISTGLTQLFKPQNKWTSHPFEENELAYELGSKIGGAIQATKKLPIIDKLLSQNPKSRLSDDGLFEKAYDELHNSNLVKGVWGRALSESGGDEKKAEALYLKLRVQQIKDEKHLSAQKKQARKKVERKKQLVEERAKKESNLIRNAEVARLNRLEQEQQRLEIERLEKERFDALPERPFRFINIIYFVIFVGLFFFMANMLIEYGKSL
jgi:hypothetical protein